MYLNPCANPFLKPPQDIVEQTIIPKDRWFIISVTRIRIFNFLCSRFVKDTDIQPRENIMGANTLFGKHNYS